MKTRFFSSVSLATLLFLSILVFPAIYYKNLELIDSEGKLNAVVAVGSKSDISDSIGASRIAQFLAQNGFTSGTIHASLSHLPRLICNLSAVPEQGKCLFSGKSAILELSKATPRQTFFSLKLGDYLDNYTGNRQLDITPEELEKSEFLEYGLVLDKARLGVLGDRAFKVDGTDYKQSDKIFLTGFSLNNSFFIPVQFLYKTEFRQYANFHTGIEKCFTNFQQDSYYAYCSVTNDPEYFIGNKRVSINILGHQYVLLDMSIPFVSSLSSKGDYVMGGKIALGESETYVDATSGQAIQVGDLNFSIYVFPEWVEFRNVSSGRTVARLFSGQIANISGVHVKLWSFGNSRAKLSIFGQYHLLENKGQFKGFYVFLKWTNNGPEPRLTENSRRADALKAIYLLKTDIGAISEFSSKEVGVNSGLFIQNYGFLSEYKNMSIVKSASSITYGVSDGDSCVSVSESPYYKIQLPDSSLVYFTGSSGRFLTIANASNSKCGAFQATGSSYYGIAGLMQQLYLVSENGTLSIAGAGFTAHVVLNGTLYYGNSLAPYGVQLLNITNSSLILGLPLQEQEIVLSIESSMVLIDYKEIRIPENGSAALFDSGAYVNASVNIESGQCNVSRKNMHCFLDTGSFKPVLLVNGTEINYSSAKVFRKATYIPENLVDLDINRIYPDGSKVLISVGGYEVNMHSGSMPKISPGEKGIYVIGRKIIIAGYSKEDTISAVEEFLSALSKQSLLNTTYSSFQLKQPILASNITSH